MTSLFPDEKRNGKEQQLKEMMQFAHAWQSEFGSLLCWTPYTGTVTLKLPDLLRRWSRGSFGVGMIGPVWVDETTEPLVRRIEKIATIETCYPDVIKLRFGKTDVHCYLLTDVAAHRGGSIMDYKNNFTKRSKWKSVSHEGVDFRYPATVRRASSNPTTMKLGPKARHWIRVIREKRIGNCSTNVRKILDKWADETVKLSEFPRVDGPLATYRTSSGLAWRKKNQEKAS
jgi:hypothetical protein